MYTTQGYMTPADIDDYVTLTDTGRHPDCPGHDDEDAWYGIIYCSRAEICPDADDLEPL